MWDVRRSLRLDRLPQEQVVVFFRYPDAEEGKRAWWLVAEETGADLCFSDPGFPIDLQIDAEARRWRRSGSGRLELGTAMRSRRVKLRGPEHLVRSVPDWLGFSTFAYPDPAAEMAAREARWDPSALLGGPLAAGGLDLDPLDALLRRFGRRRRPRHRRRLAQRLRVLTR